MDEGDAVFVAGHGGMVGSAVVRALRKAGHDNIILAGRDKVNLINQSEVEDFFKSRVIDHVVLAAAKVGGIHANNEYPADFIYQNLMIEANVINACHQCDVDHLLFLGSSCIYPKLAPQPIKEEDLLTGHLETTNEPYAIAKIAGIKLCESYNRQFGRNYRSVMPTNLYGPNDNFHPVNSHVLPALIRRFHFAKEKGMEEVTIWGTGTPRREFLHVDDLAAACVFIMGLDSEMMHKSVQPMLSHINIGTGIDHTIAEISNIIASVTNFEGRLIFDSTKPDGTPRKLLDVALINSLGWESKIALEDGLESTYQWFMDNIECHRGT